MTRKVSEVTITEDGRDKGKVFVLEEMSAFKTEKWAFRAILALARSGVDLPENIKEAGLPGLAALGLRALMKLDVAEAEPLLDEMLRCVRIKPSQHVVRDIIEDDIEEPSTLLRLRLEVFDLHTGFSAAAVLARPRQNSTIPAAA